MNNLLKLFVGIFLLVSIVQLPDLYPLPIFEANGALESREDTQNSAEIDKIVSSPAFKIQAWFYWASLAVISFGGILLSALAIRKHQISIISVISICLIFLLTQGSPWENLFLFDGVDNYNSLMRRFDILWKYEMSRELLIKSYILGTFYSLTCILFFGLFIKKMQPKSNK